MTAVVDGTDPDAIRDGHDAESHAAESHAAESHAAGRGADGAGADRGGADRGGSSHGHGHEEAEETLGPVDVVAWGYAMAGTAIGLVTAAALYVASAD